MRIVFLGAPGSGKGTQAEFIVSRHGIVHISTGDLLRAEMAAGSALGLKAKVSMDSGALVPDDIMLGIIEDRLAKPDTDNGFLLDGFPRTIVQAQVLDAMLEKIGQPLDGVLFFDVDYDEITSRLLARGRADDVEVTIRKRLGVYEEQTAPLKAFYRESGRLKTVKGIGEIEDIATKIEAELEAFA